MKEIPQYPMYSITPNGEVFKNGRKLAQNKCKKGYMKCDICIDGKKWSKKVHRLVAMAYLPNPNNYPQVNHINGIKDDNRVENLEWCDNSQNLKHAYKLGLKKDDTPKGVMSHKAKIVLHKEYGVYFTMQEAARLEGVGRGYFSKNVQTFNKYAYERAL